MTPSNKVYVTITSHHNKFQSMEHGPILLHNYKQVYRNYYLILWPHYFRLNLSCKMHLNLRISSRQKQYVLNLIIICATVLITQLENQIIFVPYLWLVWLCCIFHNFLINSTIFQTMYVTWNVCFDFSVILLLGRRIQRYYH